MDINVIRNRLLSRGEDDLAAAVEEIDAAMGMEHEDTGESVRHEINYLHPRKSPEFKKKLEQDILKKLKTGKLKRQDVTEYIQNQK